MSNTVNNYTETDLGNISLNPRGEYDNSAAYEYLDTVSYQGGSYFCLAELETTITGIAPDAGHNSEHWQMIAAPGDMTPEYTAAYNDVIKKAVQVEISRAAVELAQQEIEAVQTDVQQLHSDTVQAAQEAENSKNSAANSAQSAEQSRNAASESEQNVNAQIAGFDSRVSEAVEQSKEEINTAKQQAIDTIANQQNTSVNAVKTEGEKIITRVENDAKIVADDRVTVEEAAQTVLNNAQEVAQNTQTVASNTENAAASAESAKTSADNAAQSAKSVEDASKQIEQNKKDVASLKEDLSGKIAKPSTAPSIGKILKVTTVNDDGTFVCEWADAPSGGGAVDDVQINGKSIVGENGVAKIPKLQASNINNLLYGLPTLSDGNNPVGIGITVDGSLMTNPARRPDIMNRVERDYFDISFTGSDYHNAICPGYLDYAVKAAMCDGKGAAWTADEQAAARERMGTWTTIADITLDEDVSSINEISVSYYQKYSVVLLLSQAITVDYYIYPELNCGNNKSAIAYENAKNMTFLLFGIEEFGYIGGVYNSSLFGCESYKSEIGAISPSPFKYSTGKVNYNSAGKFPFLTGISIAANGVSIPSGSRIIIRGYN